MSHNDKFFNGFVVAIGSEKNLLVGLPQRSATPPLIYAKYASDLSKPIGCKIAVYADDTAIHCSQENNHEAMLPS